MTIVYAHLADTTIREHRERAQKININGEPIDTRVDRPLAETEWVKHNLARAKKGSPQRLMRPAAAEILAASQRVSDVRAVRHAAEFLPQHRRQLDDTRALIARAEADGHTRLQLPSVPSVTSGLRATCAIGLPVSCTISTAPSRACPE